MVDLFHQSGTMRSRLQWLMTKILISLLMIGESRLDAAKTVRNGSILRHDHLDYLDADTLRYYLSTTDTLEYDVAIMFYAQWSTHCHSLAPMWDQISRVLKAGTKPSKMIVGLFDCESTLEHEELCQSVGVTKYPTLAFFSMAGKNHRLSRRTPKHVTKYQANWQFGDALLDWIRAMSALAQWHRAGWGQRIRNFLFGRRNKKNLEWLPLGVPFAIAEAQELQSLRTEMNRTLSLAVRSSALLDVIFTPVREKESSYPLLNDSGRNYTDVYAMLQELSAWKPGSTSYSQIARTCATELTLDYCDRLSTNFMETWIDTWPLQKKLTEAAFADFQSQLAANLNGTEPHCVHMDECSLSNFTKPVCQPKSCPFRDYTACRYLTACLTDSMQLEYAEAMGLLPSRNKLPEFSKTKGGLSWGL
jgi:thiol-disulfide isomerase/thioredoxin